MTTARKKVTHRADASSTAFEVYEDNGSRFHWRLLTSDGRNLGHSDEIYASPRDAEHAAEEVRERVGAATIERDLTSGHPSFNGAS